MIRFITSTQAHDVVAAEGPQYDFHHVMDVGFRMLRDLAAAVKARDPKARLVSGLPGEAHWKFYDATTELVMKAAMVDLKSQVDIAEHRCMIEAWPYQASFQPFGGDGLMKTAEGYRTTDGAAPKELDAVPQIVVARSMCDAEGALTEESQALIDFAFGRERPRKRDPGRTNRLFFSEDDHAFIRKAWSAYVDCGVEISCKKVMVHARFPHAVFGTGTGPVRISVIR